MTSRVASAAAQGTGPPPKVLPRSPCAMVALTRSAQITAPIGSPDARPLAMVMISGVTPKDSAAVKAPTPANSTLHLVEYQHRTDPVRGTAGGGEEFGGAVPRTGHALDRLEDQRRDCLIEGCLERRRRC